MSLAFLGPYGAMISVGLELLTIAIKLYNGNLFKPAPTDFEKTMTKLASISDKIDGLNEKMNNMVKTLSDRMELNLIKSQYFETLERNSYAIK